MESLKILLSLLTSMFRDQARRARQTATVGASAVEYILIVLLGVAIVGIIAVAITAYVNSKTAELG